MTTRYTPDPRSPTFMWFKDTLEDHLDKERNKLEGNQNPEDTAKSRGRIQLLKALLSEMEKLSTR